jgi:phospholipid/cholesterol/gamma-HCH transport system substrate-binding protein
MPDRAKSELQLGIFVFIGLIILAILIFSIGDFKTWNSGYNVVFDFGFINGVKVGAPVRFAGMDVGEVKNMSVVVQPETKNTRVRVDCWLKKEIKIPVDSAVWINTLGLLGEKYIEIMPGKNYDSVLKPDTIFIGKDPIAMHEVAQIAKDLASEINTVVTRLQNKEGTVGRLLYDDAVYKEIEVIMKTLEELTLDLKSHPWKLFFKPKEKTKTK